MSGSVRAGHPPKTIGLDLEERFEPVLRALAAKARFLDAAKRRGFRRDHSRVDADNAVFKRFGDSPDASDVASKKIGGKSELGGVGDRNRFLLRLEPEEQIGRASCRERE